MALPLLLMCVMAALAVGEWMAVRSELPPVVASTFGWNGEAVGWMGRDAFFTVLGALYALWIGLFAGLPRLLVRLPAELFNLPHRDFWLADERREETVATIGAWLAWVGAVGLGVLVWVGHAVVEANRREPARLGDELPWILGATMALLAWWIWRLYRRFASLP